MSALRIKRKPKRNQCATCRKFYSHKLSRDTGECVSCYSLTKTIASSLGETPLQAFKRRDISANRTPYYVPDLPDNVYTLVAGQRFLAVKLRGHDYQGDEEQFVGFGCEMDEEMKKHFIDGLASAMERSNHHPAHIYAVRATGLLIHDRNFRDVPEEWTSRWHAATSEYEEWVGEVTDQADPSKAFTASFPPRR